MRSTLGLAKRGLKEYQMTETGQVPNAAEVADRFAIMDVLNMHSRGVDRASAEILKSAYWPNIDLWSANNELCGLK